MPGRSLLLVRLFERRLGRPLAEAERAALAARLERLGPERLGDVVVDLDGPSIDATFRARARHSSRRLSTMHFVHRGYWIWLIPLRGGVTSVGIVVPRSSSHPVTTSEFTRSGGCR